MNAKLTLMVCPNDVVNQWSKNILDIFRDSVVISGPKIIISKKFVNGLVFWVDQQKF